MPHYSIFGGCLASDIPFPQLRSLPPTTPRWTLRVATTPPDRSAAELIGEHAVSDTIRLRVSRLAGGFRLHYSDTGTFDIVADGREITWSPEAGARLEDVRDCVIGRVFATALHASHLFCLHGSAVAVNGRALAFLAPPFHGKSTLALALARDGARLITDDTVVVEPGAIPVVWPGVHSVRLFSDSADRLERREIPASTGFTAKHHVSNLPDAQLMFERTTLEAIYLLTPTFDLPTHLASRRTALAGVPAAVSLLAHLKLGPVLGKSEAPILMERAVALADRVPVYRLEIARDFAQLDAAVAQLMVWHGDARPRQQIAASAT
ncbi:MAG: hypothetical protein M3068_07235 [Gemmatimonadota bacterium]|nr:hypothetical protein [Gemmatimonadota bacterium]